MRFRKFLMCFLLSCLSVSSVSCADEIDETVVPAGEASSAAGDELARDWTTDWYSDAEGYARALADYEQTHRPMAVYMNVKWCPYCRVFEKNVLSDSRVRRFMRDVIKVKINPEAGRREHAIAARYGIMGYPSFFVHPPNQSKTIQLYTGVSPEQFIELFKKTLK
jgi:thiol:disulfide interchange protein